MSSNRDLERTADRLASLFFLAMPIGAVAFPVVQVLTNGAMNLYLTLMGVWVAACVLGLFAAYFLGRYANKRIKKKI